MRINKLITASSLALLCVAMSGCTAIERELKSLESGTKGLHRKVEVYSMDGTIIKTYESKSMLVTDGDGGTITLDFDGRRVTVCNSQIVIEEVGAE